MYKECNLSSSAPLVCIHDCDRAGDNMNTSISEKRAIVATALAGSHCIFRDFFFFLEHYSEVICTVFLDSDI